MCVCVCVCVTLGCKAIAHFNQPRIQDLAKGGGRFYWRGGTLTMNACEARGGYEKRGEGGAVRFRPIQKRGGGGGGAVLSVLGPIRKAGGGGGVQSASGPIRKVDGGGGGLLAVR